MLKIDGLWMEFDEMLIKHQAIFIELSAANKDICVNL